MINENTHLGEMKEYYTSFISPGSDERYIGSLINGGAFISGGALGRGHGIASTGSPTMLYVPYKSGLDFFNTDSYSVSFWYNSTGAQIPSSVITEKWEGNTGSMGSGYAFTFRQTSVTNAISFRSYDGVLSSSATSTGSYNNGSWHFIAGIRDYPLGSLLLYINNSLVASGRDATTFEINGLNSPIGIFYRNGSSTLHTPSPVSGTYWAGSIDDFRVYKKALSLAEIGSLYLKKHVTNSLVWWYPFNEGTGSYVYDQSDGNFDYYTDSINGTIQEILFLPSTAVTAGSLFIFVSGLEEQIAFYSSGISNVDYKDTYPIVYQAESANATGSPQSFTKRIINGPLHIVGSNMYESQLKILYT